jgi:hypothetical protein
MSFGKLKKDNLEDYEDHREKYKEEQKKAEQEEKENKKKIPDDWNKLKENILPILKNRLNKTSLYDFLKEHLPDVKIKKSETKANLVEIARKYIEKLHQVKEKPIQKQNFN